MTIQKMQIGMDSKYDSLTFSDRTLIKISFHLYDYIKNTNMYGKWTRFSNLSAKNADYAKMQIIMHSEHYSLTSGYKMLINISFHLYDYTKNVNICGQWTQFSNLSASNIDKDLILLHFYIYRQWTWFTVDCFSAWNVDKDQISLIGEGGMWQSISFN